MRGYDLTDFEWGVIRPFLPKHRRGVAPMVSRRVLNGTSSGTTHGRAMAGVAGGLGPLYMICDNCFVRWRNADVYERNIAAVSDAYDSNAYMIDATMIRLHQRAANPNKTNRIGISALRAVA